MGEWINEKITEFNKWKREKMYTFHFENATDVALWIKTMRVSTCAKVLG